MRTPTRAALALVALSLATAAAAGPAIAGETDATTSGVGQQTTDPAPGASAPAPGQDGPYGLTWSDEHGCWSGPVGVFLDGEMLMGPERLAEDMGHPGQTPTGCGADQDGALLKIYPTEVWYTAPDPNQTGR